MSQVDRRLRFAGVSIAALLGCGREPAPSRAAAAEARSQQAPPPATRDTVARDTLSSPTVTAVSRLVSERWTFDLDSMIKRRAIRVLVPSSRLLYYEERGRLRGVSSEIVAEFERTLNQKLKTGPLPIECIMIPVPRDQLLSRLVDGLGDLAVGAIAVTPEREQRVDFSEPVFRGVREIVVTGPGSPPLQKLEDLAGREVYVRASSSYAENLRRLNERWGNTGVKPVVLRSADENLEDEDILELVNTGAVPVTVVDSVDAAFYHKFLPKLTVRNDLEISSGGSFGWAMRKGTPRLKEEVNQFVREHRVGTAFGNIVTRRYYRENPWTRNPTAPEDQRRYDQVIGAFRKYGAEFDLDPLLLLAQGYQESGLDQSRRSHAGAVGVMQIKPSTAAGPPINITGVDQLENNVRAGAKYLRFVIDRYYRDQPMTPLDKEIFAIASYNAGPARIAKLRRQAGSIGLDSNRWFQNVELVVSREIGRETVDYVGNIYKYYLTYNLLEQRRQARERARAGS
jgi:membrane-bound lytic murein transglycosylase MltF